jgi:hypothetical protein
MKTRVLMGLFGILLMSSAALPADDIGTAGPGSNSAARSETGAEEAVDCFYEYNQSNSLCQQDKGPHRVAHAGQLRQEERGDRNGKSQKPVN